MGETSRSSEREVWPRYLPGSTIGADTDGKVLSEQGTDRRPCFDLRPMSVFAVRARTEVPEAVVDSGGAPISSSGKGVACRRVNHLCLTTSTPELIDRRRGTSPGLP